MDFRKLISPKSRKEIVRANQALCDFQALAPREMADALLLASRQLIDSGLFSTDPTYSYDEWAIYRVIPAIARELAGPDLVLREDEIAKPEEKNDPVTWYDASASDHLEKLTRFTESVLSNGSFRRAHLGDEETVRAEGFLFGFNREICAAGIAIDTILPGLRPKRADVDMREPLPGFQLIASQPSGRDGVLKYRESVVDLVEYMRVALALREEKDMSKQDERLSRDLMSVTAKIKDCTAISIQDFDGAILRETRFDLEPEIEPSL